MSRQQHADNLYDLVTEAQFHEAVVMRAQLYGWWVWHDTDSRRNQAGLPDLLLVRPPRVVFAELKTVKGRVSGVQKLVLDLLDQCPGIECYVWRPSDELSLDAILRRE